VLCGVIADRRWPPRAAGPRRAASCGLLARRDLLGLGAADLGDILIGAAVRFLDELRGVLPPQLPGNLLPDVGEVPDVGVDVVAAGPLPDYGSLRPKRAEKNFTVTVMPGCRSA
jgi:hypothetical protein